MASCGWAKFFFFFKKCGSGEADKMKGDVRRFVVASGRILVWCRIYSGYQSDITVDIVDWLPAFC